MKTSRIVILSAVMIVIIGLVYATAKPRADSVTTNPATSPSLSTLDVTPSTSDTPPTGMYKNYDSAILASTPGTKILFFHAPWCPQCRALEASITSGQIPDGVTIFKVDYDSNQSLRKTYGVTIQTTLVKLGNDGGIIKKYVAYDEPSLSALKKNLLP